MTSKSPQTVAANETASIDIGAFESQGVRAIVFASRKVRVNAMISNATTDDIVALVGLGSY